MSLFYWGAILLLAIFAGRADEGLQYPTPPEPHSTPCTGYLMPSSYGPGSLGPGPGDVFVNCWEETIQLTRMGDVSSWAIDSARSRLLVVRTDSVKQDKGKLVAISLISGKEEKNTPISKKARLVSTCGTVFAIEPVTSGSSIFDAFSGGKIEPPGDVQEIRCDSKKTTTVSLRKTGTVSGGPLVWQTETLGTEVSDFDVSPNGRFIAFNDVGKLCVHDKDSRRTSCLEEFSQIGRFSVWDDGSVAASAETSQACPLTSKLTAARISHKWPCPAMFEWKAGARAQWLQFLGMSPQILPVEVGRLLVANSPHR